MIRFYSIYGYFFFSFRSRQELTTVKATG